MNATGGIAFWFTITGSNVHLTGTNNILTGWINCASPALGFGSLSLTSTGIAYGQAWWDANTGTGLVRRSTLEVVNVR